MPEIPEVNVKTIPIREIPSWQINPPQSIPNAPPITLELGFPIADIPGCVETRNTQPGNASAYDTDPKGNFVVCDGTMPSFRPLDLTPGIKPPIGAKPPAMNVPEKSAGDSSQPTKNAPSPSDNLPDISKLALDLPCPPPDAIPLGAKNKSQTAVVIGYNMVNGKCEPQYQPLEIPTIIGNYLPGAPAVITTATIAAVATTATILARPLGDILLKTVKPIVKKTIKKIKEKLGKQIAIESVSQRRQTQRALRK